MAIELIKVDLTNILGSPCIISQNKNSSLCNLHGKIGIQMNNTVYTSKEKNYEFSSKKPSATKHSPPFNVYHIEFYRNFFYFSIV